MDNESSYMSTQYSSDSDLTKSCSICFKTDQFVIALPCCCDKSLCTNCLDNLTADDDGTIDCWSCGLPFQKADLLSVVVRKNVERLANDEQMVTENTNDSEKSSGETLTIEKAQEEMELSSPSDGASDKQCDMEGGIAQLAVEYDQLVERLNEKEEEIFLLNEEIVKNREGATEASQLAQAKATEFEVARRVWQDERQQLLRKIEEVSYFEKAVDNLKHQLVGKDNEIRKLQDEMDQLKPAPALGIDIGTCHSCTAYFENDQVQSVLNEREDSIINTNVKFAADDKICDEDPVQFGVEEETSSTSTVSFLKRLLCLEFPAALKQTDRHSLPFHLFSGFGTETEENHETFVHVPARPDEDFTLLEILALFLDKLKSNAQTYFKGRKVQDAVIVVPANFSDSQRQAVLDAANILGLNVLRLLNETNAAFYAYRHRVGENDRIQSLLMVSVGGGVTEIAYLQKTESGHLEAQECHAIPFGGEDFDALLAKHYLSICRQQMGRDESNNREFVNQLKKECRKVKENLSCIKSVDFKFKMPDETYFYMTATRKDFEELLAKHFLPQFRQMIEKVVQNRMPPEEIVLTGGSMRIPMLQQELQQIFPDARICKSVNYGEAIAHGAAIQASILAGHSQSLIPATTFPNYTSMTFDCFAINVETDQIIFCWRMVHSFPLPYDGRIYHELPDRITAAVGRSEFAIKVNINKMPFGVAILKDCRLEDLKFHVKLDKNGVITRFQVALASQPNNATPFQRFSDGISKAEARQIAGTVDNYHEEVQNRIRQKELCNKLDSLIAFSERIAASNRHGFEFGQKCCEWVKWFDNNANSSIQVLGSKYLDIANHLKSIGVEVPEK